MRKQIAAFSIILVISSALGAQISDYKHYKLNEDIRSYKISEKPNFSVLATTNHEAVLFHGNESKTLLKRDSWGNVAPSIDKILAQGETRWLLGTQYRDPLWAIFDQEGNRLSKSPKRTSHDRGAFISKDKIFTTSMHGSLIQNSEGETISDLQIADGWMIPKEVENIDEDKERELFLERASGEFYSLLDDGEEIWRLEGRNEIKLISDEKMLVRKKNKISMRFTKNKSLIWSKDISTNSLPGYSKEEIVVPLENKLIFLKNNGSKARELKINRELKEIKSIPESNKLIGSASEELFLINESDIETSKKFKGRINNIRVKKTSTGEIIASLINGKSLKIQKIKTSNETQRLFSHRQKILKRISINQSIFLSQKDSENFVSKEKYFSKTPNKQPYIAALAAKDNASITFNRSKADRDFSNYSMRELKKEFVNKYEPNHVAVADLDSKSGLLAGFMAVKQGAMPVDFDQERVYAQEEVDEVGAERYNRDNGVIQLEDKIRDNFELIGLNQEVITDGRYVSILDGPRKAYEDPVENGFIGDEKDGDYFFSDKEYGNLDEDDELEAAVGRYPDNVSLAAEMFKNSLEKDRGGKAVVASEYLYSYGPEVLANFGGGVWHGKSTGNAMDRQDYSVTFLSEHRAQPVSLFFKLLGVPDGMDVLVNGFKQTKGAVTKYVGESTFKVAKNALVVVKRLQDSKEVLQVYLEHDWRNWKPLEEVDLPDSASQEEVGELVVSLLPERYDRLNSSSLQEGIKNSSAVYYAGIGDSDRWLMPGEGGGLKKRYREENSFTPNEIPETNNAIIWDSSDLATERDAEMMKGFANSGATNVLGASSVSYSSYSAVAANDFFRHGKKVGRSYKSVVNELSDRFVVPSTKSVYRTGVQEKMVDSLSLYGNPETPKDPVQEDSLEPETSCEGGKCKLELKIDTERQEVETSNGTRFIFDTDEYLTQPLLPITPLYSLDFEASSTEIIEKQVDLNWSYRKNVSPLISRPVTGSGEVLNSTVDYERFPEEPYRLEKVGNEIEYIQPGAIYFENSSSKVLESAEVEVTYEPEVAVEVFTENRSIKTSVSEKVDSLYYSIGGNHSSIEKPNLEEVLGKPGPGRHRVEVHAAREGEKLGYTKEEVIIESPVEITLFAPDVHKNSVREVRAIVRNPNNFSIDRALELKTGEKLQLGFLESPKRKTTIEGDSRIQLSWSFTGIEEGQSKVELKNSSVDIEIRPATSTEKLFSAESLLKSFYSQRQSFTYTRTSDIEKLTLETLKGSISKKTFPTNESYILQTNDYRFREFESSQENFFQLSTKRGSYTQFPDFERVSGIEKEEFLSKKKIFEREKSKLDKRLELVRP